MYPVMSDCSIRDECIIRVLVILSSTVQGIVPFQKLKCHSLQILILEALNLYYTSQHHYLLIAMENGIGD